VLIRSKDPCGLVIPSEMRCMGLITIEIAGQERAGKVLLRSGLLSVALTGAEKIKGGPHTLPARTSPLFFPFCSSRSPGSGSGPSRQRATAFPASVPNRLTVLV